MASPDQGTVLSFGLKKDHVMVTYLREVVYSHGSSLLSVHKHTACIDDLRAHMVGNRP